MTGRIVLSTNCVVHLQPVLSFFLTVEATAHAAVFPRLSQTPESMLVVHISPNPVVLQVGQRQTLVGYTQDTGQSFSSVGFF